MQPKTVNLNIEEHNIFFSSDQHLMHHNIIEYCDRPFRDVEEMNKNIIQNWNAVVNPDDVVFIGGDFCFGGKKEWLWMLDALVGRKYLTYGNHDKSVAGNFILEAQFIDILIRDPEIKDGQRITVCHYPMASWYQSHRGSWMLYGHLHGKLTEKSEGDNKYDISNRLSPNHLDIGVDSHDFTPVSYHDVKTIITKQNLKK